MRSSEKAEAKAAAAGVAEYYVEDDFDPTTPASGFVADRNR